MDLNRHVHDEESRTKKRRTKGTTLDRLGVGFKVVASSAITSLTYHDESEDSFRAPLRVSDRSSASTRTQNVTWLHFHVKDLSKSRKPMHER